MSKNVVLGGQRLGAGNKISVNLHNYDRANFNLDKIWRSSMSCGTLVPFYCNVGLNGDSFDINLRHIIKTLPTVGPLMGSFKVQMDMFTVPIRLYNGLLHNNSLGIAMKMEDVKFPKMSIEQTFYSGFDLNKPYKQINPSSLVSYLGIKGLGSTLGAENGFEITREFNAVPLLGYLDIFKNYYSNKQEKHFYQITVNERMLLNNVIQIGNLYLLNGQREVGYTVSLNNEENFESFINGDISILSQDYIDDSSIGGDFNGIRVWFANEKDLSNFKNDYENNNLSIKVTQINSSGDVPTGLSEKVKLKSLYPKSSINEENNYIDLYYENAVGGFVTAETIKNTFVTLGREQAGQGTTYWLPWGIQNYGNGLQRNVTELDKIELESLDKIREDILSEVKNQLGVPFRINTLNYKVIQNIVGQTASGQANSRYAQNGLLVKTYMSDIYNNWLNTETIEGANGISEITKVSTADGGFTIDALNLAQKVYNLLNRIAVSGGTYNDWQEVVWDVETVYVAESPIYVGGYSSEIIFEEVVSQSATQEANLGNIAGRGKVDNVKGGEINISIKEPSFIMGILSITPRIDYSQGNRWYMTDLDSLDDLHMPALDGIGFQDLMTEKLCATDTYLEHKGAGVFGKASEQNAIGKQPAWLDWQTDFNEVYGTFAIPEQTMFMTLARNYDTDERGNVLDITTYVDPKKFNYAFTDAALEAQNFWVQIGIDVSARRKMSAKIMPNI